jgi:hypothetical protein
MYDKGTAKAEENRVFLCFCRTQRGIPMQKFNLEETLQHMAEKESTIILKVGDSFYLGTAGIIGMLNPQKVDQKGKVSDLDGDALLMVYGEAATRELIHLSNGLFEHVLDLIHSADPAMVARLYDAVVEQAAQMLGLAKNREGEGKH